jgi:hypothetical protein
MESAFTRHTLVNCTTAATPNLFLVGAMLGVMDFLGLDRSYRPDIERLSILLDRNLSHWV